MGCFTVLLGTGNLSVFSGILGIFRFYVALLGENGYFGVVLTFKLCYCGFMRVFGTLGASGLLSVVWVFCVCCDLWVCMFGFGGLGFWFFCLSFGFDSRFGLSALLWGGLIGCGFAPALGWV